MSRSLWLFIFALVGGLLVALIIRLREDGHSARFVDLGLGNSGIGDSCELAAGRTIVLLSIGPGTKCDFQLIGCENNSCRVLEQFTLSMEDNDAGPPAEIFLLGFKIRLVMLQSKDQVVTLEISKI